ncbi:MAG: peptidoglycan D,D-transpeptidase FtsI family protein [Acidimicrobiia bacterium]
MNVGIRRVGIAILVLFIGLAAQLTYLQVVDSSKLANDPHNTRKFLQDLRQPRGDIVTSDGVVVAESVPVNDDYRYQRVYPSATAELFAQVVGYQSINFGSVGVEAQYSSELAGRDPRLAIHSLRQIVAGQPVTGTVVLAVSAKAQAAAAAALDGRAGSVVVLDVHTGGIVALYSNPTFDPNSLASHNSNDAQLALEFLTAAPGQPLLSRAWRQIYPPGSTFKTVTAATTLDYGVDIKKNFPQLKALTLPLTTNTLQNFGDERCGGSLESGFVQSCNTTYGQVGLDLGDRLALGTERFGVNTPPPPSDLDPGIVASIGPKPGTYKVDAPLFAQAAIGQGPVAVTPIEMALVAESVATGGVMLEPHVVDRIENSDGTVVRQITPTVWRRTMTPQTAATLTQFMIQVVERGTGTPAQIPGIQVAGKTGTAETGTNAPPHAWFIAFAPANNPQYAIAVLIEHGGSSGLGAEATGGHVAAPVAAQVLRALLEP